MEGKLENGSIFTKSQAKSVVGYISRDGNSSLDLERSGNLQFHPWWGNFVVVFRRDRYSHHRLCAKNLVADIGGKLWHNLVE